MDPFLTYFVAMPLFTVAWAVIRALLIALPIALVVRALQPAPVADPLAPPPQDELRPQPNVRDALLISPPWVAA